VNLKAFFVDALSAALELKIGTPEDVLRLVTPDVLAQHLPRPLWARLLTACLGAPRVDARLVVETIGVPNLCEHIPSPIIWACIADIGTRSLGKTPEVAAPAASLTVSSSGRAVLAPPPDPAAPVATPPPAAPVAVGPSIPAPVPAAPVNEPLADLINELEQGDDARAAQVARSRTSTSQRFRQSNTGIGRGGLGTARRPQAVATPSATQLPRLSGRRGGTEVTAEPEPETAVEKDWREKEIAVDDSQLVDWQTDVSAASAITGDDDFSDLGSRKR
jgi:hypothetical protein